MEKKSVILCKYTSNYYSCCNLITFGSFYRTDLNITVMVMKITTLIVNVCITTIKHRLFDYVNYKKTL
jgi:hypothetical protein